MRIKLSNGRSQVQQGMILAFDDLLERLEKEDGLKWKKVKNCQLCNIGDKKHVLHILDL